MNYFQVPAINNSSLSVFNYDPSYYEKVYITKEIENKKESDSLVFGSLVHCIILESEKIKERYHISQLKPEDFPTGMMLDFINKLMFFEVHDELAYDAAYQASGYKISKDKVLENFKKFDKYYQELLITKGKTVITQAVYDSALNASLVAMANPQWDNLLISRSDWKEYKELEIYWVEEIKGEELQFKAKLDHLFIRVLNNSVLARYFDYKTDSKNPVHKYLDTFLYWKTYRQMAFYQKAIVAFVTQEFPEVELLVKPQMHLVSIDAVETEAD